MDIDLFNPFFDCFGHPLEVGDTVAWPTLCGSSIYTSIGMIEEIVPGDESRTYRRRNELTGRLVDCPEWRVRIRPAGGGRAVSVKRVENLAKLVTEATLAPDPETAVAASGSV